MNKVTRPVLRYFGGKFRLAPWIIDHMPAHRVYVEPFGGAASVLLQKPRSYAEIYNDLDGEVVNVFRVLQNRDEAAELERLVRATPFARREFLLAYKPIRVLDRPEKRIEQARRTIIKAFMGYGSNAIHVSSAAARGFRTRMSTERGNGIASVTDGTGGGGIAFGAKISTVGTGFRTKNSLATGTGFRSDSSRSGTTPAADWANWFGHIKTFTERLHGVVIEERDASEVISKFDRPDALHYVDPPYPHATRSNARRDKYKFEMSDDAHRTLATALHGCAGMVVLSGYPCDLYDRELYADWYRVTRDARVNHAKKATEVLWLNPAASSRLTRSLFDE